MLKLRTHRFAVVTFFGGAVSLGSFAIFVTLGIHYFLAGILSFYLAATHNFLLGKFWAYQCKNPRIFPQYLKYLTFALGGLLVQQIVLTIFIEMELIAWPILARFIASLTGYVFNFTTNHRYTFSFSQLAHVSETD